MVSTATATSAGPEIFGCQPFRPPDPTSRMAERLARRASLVEFARTRDPALRDELVAAHLWLAALLARRYLNRGEPLDDLIQVASVGLVKAVDRFEPSRGSFSAYATPTINGELRRYFRDKAWAIRAPRRLQERYATLVRAREELSRQSCPSPTVAQLAAHLRLSDADVLEALMAGGAYRTTSIDACPTGSSPDTDDVIAHLSRSDSAFDDAERRADLRALLTKLSRREQAVVHLLFFEGRTQCEVAEDLGISQMHVSRLLAGSLARLRQVARIRSLADYEPCGLS